MSQDLTVNEIQVVNENKVSSSVMRRFSKRRQDESPTLPNLNSHRQTPRFRFPQRMLLAGLLIACLMLSLSHFAWAQAPAPAPVVPAPAGGGGVIVRSLWTEILLTTVMVALSLFAVCRSSQRS